jgi:DNA sulfur modification protein DndC
MTSNRSPSLLESERQTMAEAIELTALSLQAYGPTYRHWAVAYSGGKDSTCTVTMVAWLIETGQVPAPESLTVLYADTRMELPPLQHSAMAVMAELARRGIRTQIVLPDLDKRFYVYMLGRGVPPPKNRFRWCTPMIKVEPMVNALRTLHQSTGEKLLMLTGVRIGESAARDQRIALSCSRDGAECGQGWFQESTPSAVADTLAPILHWRVCHVWDWLTFEAPGLGFPTQMVAHAYGGEQAEEINARTGCVGCNLVDHDKALDTVLRRPEWAYLAPLKRLRPLYHLLTEARHRLRKDGSDRNKDGSLAANPMRLGPLTFEARRMGLATVLGIQGEVNAAARAAGRPEISLINQEEQARIEELIAVGTWPQGWSGEEPIGSLLLPQVMGDGILQPLLMDLEH